MMISLGQWKTIIGLQSKGRMIQNSCAFFTCWYFYQLVTGGNLKTWEGDWTNRIATIAEDIFISLVNQNVSMST